MFVVGGVVLVGRVRAWLGWAGWPPERVRYATPMFLAGRTGRPPERVWCATPCCCFGSVVALLPVFPCSPSAFPCLRGCWLGACGCPCSLVPPPLPPRVVLRGCRRCAAVLPRSSPCLLVAAVPPPPPLRLVGVWCLFCFSCSRARALLRPCCAPFGCSPAVAASCCRPPPPRYGRFEFRGGFVAQFPVRAPCCALAARPFSVPRLFRLPVDFSCPPCCGWLGFCGSPAARFPMCALSFALAARPFGVPVFLLPPSPPPRGSCCVVVGSPMLVFPSLLSAWFVGVPRRWLLQPPPSPLFCVARVLLPRLFVLAPPSCCCASVCCLFPPGAAPLPRRIVLASVSRVSSPVWRCALPCCLLVCAVPCRTVPCLFVLRCRLVLFPAAVCCAVSFGAEWRLGVWRSAVCLAVPCCDVFCCAFGPGVLSSCGVLFTLCFAVSSGSGFWCAGLFQPPLYRQDDKVPVWPARQAPNSPSYRGKAPQSQCRWPDWPQTASSKEDWDFGALHI